MSLLTIDNATVILVILSLYATFLNTHKKAICFKIWLVTNTMWMLYDVWKTAYWQALLFGCYVGLAMYGIHKWKGDTNGKSSKEVAT